MSHDGKATTVVGATSMSGHGPKNPLQLKSWCNGVVMPAVSAATQSHGRNQKCSFLGRESEAAAQTVLSWGWLAVGGDGVCYRRRIQQAAHYILNGTIVKSLASRLTEVERDVILSQQNGISFGQGWSAVCQMQIPSQIRVPMNPRSLFWSQCEREPLLRAHFNCSVTHSWGRVRYWKTRVRAAQSSLGPTVFSYLAIFQSRCKFCSFYFNLYWLHTKAGYIIQFFWAHISTLTHIWGRIVVDNLIFFHVVLVSDLNIHKC